MRRILLLCALFLAGCLNVTGPFKPRSPARVDDPRLSPSEQEAKARDRWAIPDAGARIGPVDTRLTPGR